MHFALQSNKGKEKHKTKKNEKRYIEKHKTKKNER